jgi:hypothetical protein
VELFNGRFFGRFVLNIDLYDFVRFKFQGNFTAFCWEIGFIQIAGWRCNLEKDIEEAVKKRESENQVMWN